MDYDNGILLLLYLISVKTRIRFVKIAIW